MDDWAYVDVETHDFIYESCWWVNFAIYLSLAD
jgi:hypothetical protein